MDKEYNEYLWSPKQPRVYDISPLRISGTPMSEEDAAMSLRAENLQQSLQQNPIFKSTKQWAAQQEQREKEIAASKKWLELHPEDDNDDPYTIFERGKHQAIVDGKDPSYYEKMIDDGKQFTKGALTVLSLPYLSAAAAGAYGYGASLGARGLFAAQGIHGLANENGVRKTANLIKSGDYGKAALSGTGDVLNAAMVIPGARFLGNVAKYGTKSAIAGDMLNQSVRSNVPNFNKPLVKYYGPTMGKTTAKSERLIDFDDIMRPIKESLAKDLGITREELVKSGHPALQQAYADQINLWRNNSANNGKTLMVSSAGTLDPKYKITFDNYPTLPERSNFIRRNVKRGGTEEESIAWYDDLVQRFPFHIDNRFVSEIESTPKSNGLLRIGDAEINNGVYDNGYNNNQVILSFRRPKLTKTQLSEAEWLDVPKDLLPNISRSLGFSSTTGEELFMPNEILGEFVSGKNQAAKFFQQPVVQNSYAHNKELANRLGINIADRPENISEIVGAPIKLSPYIQNPGNELANIAQSYLGDPSATLSIAWTPFSKRVAKLTGIHEGLHRGHYAQVIKPASTITKNYYETTMRPEATFWNWKINKLLKPEYQNGYLGGPFDGEAGVNLIEMGRDIGVKLGAKYPGDEVFMNMINNYNGHKSFLIPHLDLNTRAGRKHVWDAMTGQYFKQGGILKRVESGKSGIHK